MRVPIVPGPPASVAAIVRGMSIAAPHTKVKPGTVGSDLQANYHALTGRAQLASLAMRDGTLIDLNSNTDVLIKDPLHTTISGGELFLSVVHGAASHQVQAGTAVAATKGTRFDVRYNAKTRSFVVTVVEGRVQVTNGKKSTLVNAGQQTTVVANRPPSPPKKVDLRAVVKWVTTLPNTTASTLPANLFPPVIVSPKSPAAQATSAAATKTALTATIAPSRSTATIAPTAVATSAVPATPTTSPLFPATPTATAGAAGPPTLQFSFVSQVPDNPSAVVPGQAVTVEGSAFRASEQVVITIDGTRLATPKVGADGTFTAPATIPANEAIGTHTVTAIEQASGLRVSIRVTVAASS